MAIPSAMEDLQVGVMVYLQRLVPEERGPAPLWIVCCKRKLAGTRRRFRVCGM